MNRASAEGAKPGKESPREWPVPGNLHIKEAASTLCTFTQKMEGRIFSGGALITSVNKLWFVSSSYTLKKTKLNIKKHT